MGSFLVWLCGCYGGLTLTSSSELAPEESDASWPVSVWRDAVIQGMGHGVSFLDDGAALVGMGGAICEVDPHTGAVGGDWMLPGLTWAAGVDGGQGLAVSEARIRVVSPGGDPDALEGPRAAGDWRGAAWVDGALVTLGEHAAGCEVSWWARPEAQPLLPEARTAVPRRFCRESVALVADPSSWTVWLAVDDELREVTPEGDHPLETPATLLAHDGAQLYTVAEGSDEVLRWRGGGPETAAILSGPITALDVTATLLAAVIAGPTLVVASPADGQVLSQVDLQRGDVDTLTVRTDGDLIGLALGDQIRFYGVR